MGFVSIMNINYEAKTKISGSASGIIFEAEPEILVSSIILEVYLVYIHQYKYIISTKFLFIFYSAHTYVNTWVSSDLPNWILM